MILLNPVVQVLTGPMANTLAEFGADRARVTVVSVRRDPGWRDAGDHLAERKNALRGGHVARLAEPHVHQRARCVDGAIQVAPAALDFDVGLVDIPVPPDLTAAPPSRRSSAKRRGELGFPVADRFVAEYDAADQEHLGQITQAQLVAQTPEHHEGDDVGRILRPVQHGRCCVR